MLTSERVRVVPFGIPIQGDTARTAVLALAVELSRHEVARDLEIPVGAVSAVDEGSGDGGAALLGVQDVDVVAVDVLVYVADGDARKFLEAETETVDELLP